ncbi:MAG: hypothetical protein IPP98_08035 [Gemmatimonadetes bacterium]|nr:hypothetical protein [Gemmatimonadota bacterium]
MPTRGTALLITHVGPRPELLRVDDFADVRVGEMALAERRDTLAKKSRNLGRLGAGFIFLLLPLLVWHAVTSPGPYVQFPAFVGAGVLGREWYRRYHRLRVSTSRLVLGVLGLGFGGFAVATGRLKPDILAFAMASGLTVTLASHLLAAKALLPSGRRVHAPDAHWDGIAIRWNADLGELSLQVRNGPWMDAVDSQSYLRLVTDGQVLPLMSDEDLTKAHLLATTHDVGGILSALDAWRQDRDDTLRLADIPVMYFVALDLAFARKDSGSSKAQLAHGKLLEAADVADEAERLDRPPEGA